MGRNHVMVAVDQGIFVLVGDMYHLKNDRIDRLDPHVLYHLQHATNPRIHPTKRITLKTETVFHDPCFFSLDVFVCFFVSKLQFSESNPPVTTTVPKTEQFGP